MSYAETKVYFDGSHYIAIPHTTRPTKKRPKRVEETITVIQENDEGPAIENITEPSVSLEQTDEILENTQNEILEEKTQNIQENTEKLSKNTVKMTKKELFNALYIKFIDLPKRKRKEKIIEGQTLLKLAETKKNLTI